MLKKILPISSALILYFLPVYSQDIDELLTEVNNTETEYAYATFKSTRIVSGHSIERMPKGQLDFRISHRFGRLNTGGYNLWGLDQAHIHFGLDYGITDWFMIGIGRGTYEKTFDGLMKFSLFRQSTGVKNMPVSVSYLATIAINTLRWEGSDEIPFWNRASYVHQLLVARKFGERLSLEVNPTFVHRNLVEENIDPNDLWAFGFGGRYKLMKRISVNIEYYYVLPRNNKINGMQTYDPLSVGFDIETGGHVFQIHFTNSVAMIEKAFIGETSGNWLDGDIHLGFNVSRVFTVN